MYHPNVYKTVECMDMPGCPRTFCQFAHGPEELRPRPKTVMSNQAMANTIASVFGGHSPASAGMAPTGLPTGLRNGVPNILTRHIMPDSPATPINSMTPVNSLPHSADIMLLPQFKPSSVQTGAYVPHEQLQRNRHINPYIDSHELFMNHPLGFAPPVPSHSMVAPRMSNEEWVRGSALTPTSQPSPPRGSALTPTSQPFPSRRNPEASSMQRWSPRLGDGRKGLDLGGSNDSTVGRKKNSLVTDIESLLKFEL